MDIQIKTNINFSPFNVIKIRIGGSENLEFKKKEKKCKLPEYYVPKTTAPQDFEIRFDTIYIDI